MQWNAILFHAQAARCAAIAPPFTPSPPPHLQLPLYPLIKSKLVLPDDIIIDAKSGEPVAETACSCCGRLTAAA